MEPDEFRSHASWRRLFAFISWKERAKDVSVFEGGVEIHVVSINVPGVRDVADEMLRLEGVPSLIREFGIVSGEDAEDHGEVVVPHEMFSALFEAVERDAEGEQDEDNPVLRDGAVVDHAFVRLTWTGSTCIRGVDPAFFDLVGVLVEGEEADICRGVSFGFVTVGVDIPCTMVEFRMRCKGGTRKLSIEIVHP